MKDGTGMPGDDAGKRREPAGWQACATWLALAVAAAGCGTHRGVQTSGPPVPVPGAARQRPPYLPSGALRTARPTLPQKSAAATTVPPLQAAWRTNRVMVEILYDGRATNGQSFAIERQSAVGPEWETIVTVTFTDTNTLSIYRVRNDQ